MNAAPHAVDTATCQASAKVATRKRSATNERESRFSPERLEARAEASDIINEVLTPIVDSAGKVAEHIAALSVAQALGIHHSQVGDWRKFRQSRDAITLGDVLAVGGEFATRTLSKALRRIRARILRRLLEGVDLSRPEVVRRELGAVSAELGNAWLQFNLLTDDDDFSRTDARLWRPQLERLLERGERLLQLTEEHGR